MSEREERFRVVAEEAVYITQPAPSAETRTIAPEDERFRVLAEETVLIGLPAGAPGPAGPPGPQGGSTSLLPYNMAASTIAPPASGEVQLDNVNGALATVLRASLVTSDGQYAQTSLITIDAGDAVSLEWTTLVGGSIGYHVTGPVVQQPGYIEVPISWSYGLIPPPGPVYLGIFRMGPQGPQGPPGPEGPPGGGGAGVRQYVQVRQAGAAQGLPDVAFTVITFDTEDFNSDGMYDAAFPSRLTAPVAGTYRLGGAISVSFHDAGYRAAHWSVNGVRVPQSPAVFAGTGATGAHVMCVSLLVGLNAGDYVEMQVFQNSGAQLTTVTAAEYQSFINMMREI